MTVIQDAFLMAVFQFKEGSHFSFSSDLVEMRIQNGYWMLNDNGSTIDVREWKDRSSSLMKIFIRKNRALTAFVMDETPFVLRVKKD